MKTLKIFVLESYGCLISSVLERLEPKLEKICEIIQEKYIEEKGKPMSKIILEITRMELTWDLCKSLEQYLQRTDNLVELESWFTNRGNTFEVSMVVERDGNRYSLATEMITAGGHNIQKLHYRYITKSNVPRLRSEDNKKSKELENKIKGLKKHQKIEIEIAKIDSRIEEAEKKIEENRKYTDEEILILASGNKKYDMFPPWKEIVRRGADKNYNYDESEYIRSSEEYRLNQIAFWKNMNIRSHEKYIIELSKSKKKLENKLSVIVNNL